MNAPLVSVITPCYNGAQFIRKALDCVRDSTYPNIEHIIIDDRSTDDSVEVLKWLSPSYQFKLIESEVNQGPANARNTAIQYSNGKYILPLDCDNYFSDDYIEKLVEAAEQSSDKHSPFYTKVVWFGEVEREIDVPEWSIERVLKSPFIDICSLFSRQAFDAAGGFDPQFTPLEDYELFFSMAVQGFQGKLVKEPTLFYQMRKDSISDHFNKQDSKAKKKQLIRQVFEKHEQHLKQANLDTHPLVIQKLDSPPKPKPETADSEMLNRIPANAKIVIEMGCGKGLLGQRYKQINPLCQYFGVETDLETAKTAAQRLDKVFVGNIETLKCEQFGIQAGTVDCLVYSDRLETVRDPQSLLNRHSQWLKPDGQVIAKFTNPQHWRSLRGLIQGQWNYEGSRCPHPQQLRFFTFDSIKQLFDRAGLQIFQMPTIEDQSEAGQTFRETLAPAIETLKLDRAQFETRTKILYYIVRAIKSPTPPRRLLIQTLMMAPRACDRVRVLEPDLLSATIPGVRTVSTVRSAALNVAKPNEEKVFIWQRAVLNPKVALEQQKNLLRRGYLIVAEIDDDPLRFPANADTEFFTFRSCHCAQTSTEPLANYLRQHNPYVGVFANQLMYLPPRRPETDGDSVTLFFGAINREQDWQPIMPAINRVLAVHQDRVRVEVLHDQKFFQALQTPHKTFEPFCPYERYQEVLGNCNIALLPLQPNRFNSMKSDLKFVECAGHGVAVLASPTVYERSLVDGETGFIYRSVEEFEAKLLELISNTQLRRKLVANAYEWVKQNRMLSQHYRERREWYLEMRDRLPELNEALRDRVPQLFESS